MGRSKEIPSFQPKNDNKMHLIMKQKAWEKVKLETHDKKNLTWAICCVNDKSPIDVKVLCVMHYILCYSKPIGHAILDISKIMENLH